MCGWLVVFFPFFPIEGPFVLPGFFLVVLIYYAIYAWWDAFLSVLLLLYEFILLIYPNIYIYIFCYLFIKKNLFRGSLSFDHIRSAGIRLIFVKLGRK